MSLPTTETLQKVPSGPRFLENIEDRMMLKLKSTARRITFTSRTIRK